jgi:NRPS condensation-like uncharacterized protein
MNSRDLQEGGPCRVKVNPFDFFSELLREQSDQVIHMVLNFDGVVDREKMQQAVMDAVHAEPICNSRLVEAGDTLWWEARSSFPARDFFSVIEETDQNSALFQTLSGGIDPNKGPQVRVFLIRAPGGRDDVLVINASHVAMDGRGLKDLAGLIMELYRRSPEDASLVIGKKPVTDRCLPLLSSFLPYTEETASIQQNVSGADCWTFPSQSCETHHPAYALMAIPASRVATIHTKRREFGVTVNDLILAVIAIASANMEGGTEKVQCSFLNTIDLRRYLQVPGRSLTNYSTAFEVRIPVKPTDTLPCLCRVVHGIMENIKNNFPGMKDALDAEQLWKSGVSTARETCRTRATDPDNPETRIPIFTNTGIIDLGKSDNSAPCVINACMLPCHPPPPSIFIAISTYRDTMTISSAYRRPAVSDEQVRIFFDLIYRFLPGYLGPGDECRLQISPQNIPSSR